MEENITPDQRNSLLDQRKKRLQEMGLPVPMTPMVPSTIVNVKDPNMLKRIQEIRSGKLKQEFQSFDKNSPKKAGFEEIPVPKPKNNSRQGINEQNNLKIHVPLEEFTAARDPNIDALEGMFESNNSTSLTTSNYGQPTSIDDGGKGFLDNFRQKLNNNLQNKQSQIVEQSYSQQSVIPQLQSGMIVLNEEDLKKKIIAIAKPIAKQVAIEVIKEVLTEYAKKTSKPIIAETQKKNNVELLKGNKVKINGTIFNLSVDPKK